MVDYMGEVKESVPNQSLSKLKILANQIRVRKEEILGYLKPF